jgi:hypothetical protein
MKRSVAFQLFHLAISILLIVASFSFLGEWQYFSQAIGSKPRTVSSSPQNERAAISPSEVVNRYWRASAAGQFPQTQRYIDFCSLNSKYSVDREIITTLTRLTPRSIYEAPEVPGEKPGKLMIERITEAKIGQAINEITVGDYTYVTTPAMRKSLSTYYVNEYEYKFQGLSEKYVSSNDSGTTSGATGGDIRQRSAPDILRTLINIGGQFIVTFTDNDIFGRGLGAFMNVKGPHSRSRERLSTEYGSKILGHVGLRAELHATTTFLAAMAKLSKPEDASPSPNGELVIGRIEEESLKGDTASVVAIIDFRGYPVTRSQFTLRRCEGKWKIDNVNLFYKDVFDLRKDLRKKEDIKKIASLTLHRLSAPSASISD